MGTTLALAIPPKPFPKQDAFIAHSVLLLPFGNQGKAALIIETNVSPVGVDSIVGESRVLRLLLAKAAERGEPLDCSHCRCSAPAKAVYKMMMEVPFARFSYLDING